MQSFAEPTRRAEILAVASELIATDGIRASLKDIADACGMLPGSLYHHFDSKEAIVVELVRDYIGDLDAVAASALEGDAAGSEPLIAVERLGTAIAEAGVRHRAALLLTFFEPPSVYSADLAKLSARAPAAITAAMRHLLGAARKHGVLRDEIDRSVLADRLCQSMLHVGIGAFHRTKAAKQVPAVKCQMLLRGIATQCPADRVLDRSVARRVADAVIVDWPVPDVDGDRNARIMQIARAEFGRRGYEATTIRDIASAAGVSARTLYRMVDSKEDLLAAALGDFADSVTTGWNAVLRSSSSALEKLDALLWLDINILDRFREEHRLQTLSMQFSPPRSSDLGVSFPLQLRSTSRVLTDGEASGELEQFGSSADVRSRCLFSLIWTPDNMIHDLGVVAALDFARATLLRGAAERG